MMSQHVTPFSRSWGSRRLHRNWISLYVLQNCLYEKSRVSVCLLYGHHYAQSLGFSPGSAISLMSPRHPYSCTEEVTSKGTVIHWLCSTAMSVNMFVQMRECPPDMCLLLGEGTWEKEWYLESRPFNASHQVSRHPSKRMARGASWWLLLKIVWKPKHVACWQLKTCTWSQVFKMCFQILGSQTFVTSPLSCRKTTGRTTPKSHKQFMSLRYCPWFRSPTQPMDVSWSLATATRLFACPSQ